MKYKIYKIGCEIIEKSNLPREKYATELLPEYIENVDEETAAIFATNVLYDAIAEIVTSAGYDCVNQNPCFSFKEPDYLKASEMRDEFNTRLTELYQTIDPAREFPGVWSCVFALEIGGPIWEGQKYTGKVYLKY